VKSITIHTYERYALDFLEGKLDEALHAQFEAFLAQHPKIRSELEGLNESMILSNEASIFPDKAILKKGALSSEKINAQNYSTYFIAAHEGDLSTHEFEQVKAFKTAHNLEKEWMVFGKLRLTNNAQLPAETKQSLKKKTSVFWMYRSLAVAATIALILGVFAWVSDEDQIYTPRMAEVIIIQPEETDFNLEQPFSASENLPSLIVHSSSEKSVDLPKPETPGLAKNQPLTVATRLVLFGHSQPENADLAMADMAEVPDLFLFHTSDLPKKETLFKFRLPSFRQEESQINDTEVLARARIPSFSRSRTNKETILDMGALRVYRKK
jgi:hypothetical protein